jgi:type II secretory pathway pseudopilin PulG
MKYRGDPAPRARAFTLLELLVVIGLIAATAFLLFGGLGGGDRAAALQSGQAIVANLVTSARTRAAATGRKTRLLVNLDPAQPSRYLRCLVLQLARQPGASPADWDTVHSLFLPAGIYVVPSSLNGLVTDPSLWKRNSDIAADLSSDLFANQSLAYALEGDVIGQVWTGVAFTPNGTLAALASGPPSKGAWVIAVGQPRPSGSYSAGHPPVQLSEPVRVRGLMLSAYGVPALLDDQSAF